MQFKISSLVSFFMAICTSATISQAAMPVLQELFNNGAPPSGWSQSKLSTSGSETWSDSSGNAVAYLNSDTTKALITPALDLSNTYDPVLSILMRLSCPVSGDKIALNIYYQSDAGGDWTLLETLTPSVTSTSKQLVQHQVMLYSTYRLAFEALSTVNGCTVNLDAVTVGSSSEATVTGVGFVGVDNSVFTDTVVQPTANSPIGDIHLSLPYSINPAYLKPIFAGLAATTTPNGTQDLTSPITYTMTSNNGYTTAQYKLTVNREQPSTSARLNSFSLCDSTGANCKDSVTITAPATSTDTGSVTVYLPEESYVSKMTVKTSISSYATLLNTPTTATYDFSNTGAGLVLKVTAQDGTTSNVYKVKISYVHVDTRVLEYWLCDPYKFGIPATSIWDPTSALDTGLIVLNLPYGTAVTSYKTCQVTVSTGVTYVVQGTQNTKGTGLHVLLTGKNGTTKRLYAVQANVRTKVGTDATVKSLTVCKTSSTNPCINGVLTTQATTTTNGQIDVTMSASTDLTTFTYTFGLTDPFAYVNADDKRQPSDWWSGITSRVFTITAENQTTALKYTVNIHFADLSTSSKLTSFSIFQGAEEIFGTIDSVAHTVAVNLTTKMNLANLLTSFSAPQGATATIKPQQYYDYTKPLAFSLTSADGSSTTQYTVTVSLPTPPSTARPTAVFAGVEIHMHAKQLTIEHANIEVQSISIYDVLGHVVKQAVHCNGTQTSLDLQDLRSGRYFVHAVTSHGAYTWNIMNH